MKKYFLLFFLWLCILLSPNNAQLSISYSHSAIQQSAWNASAEANNHSQPFTAFNNIGLGYSFRLKSYRWEFLAELRYGHMQSRVNNTLEFPYTTTAYSFHLHNRIYLFDFLNDCNCPTFSKQNTFFKRGFFLEFSPGSSLLYITYQNPIIEPGSDLLSPVLDLSSGLGLDVGFSEHFTTTPFVRFRYLHNLKNEGAELLLRPQTDSWSTIEAGLQLLWNF